MPFLGDGSELKIGRNQMDSLYQLPKFHNWTGAPADFSQLHRLDAKLPETKAVYSHGKLKELYHVLETSLWVARTQVNTSLECQFPDKCKWTLYSAAPYVEAIEVDRLNSFDSRSLFLGSKGVNKTCAETNLLLYSS
ncbi:hypothetical protein DSO57_1002152 [Entomophthora muscae]|nr:hypothetical protein DSO57_1002152 [Entomophthora muscae]